MSKAREVGVSQLLGVDTLIRSLDFRAVSRWRKRGYVVL